MFLQLFSEKFLLSALIGTIQGDSRTGFMMVVQLFGLNRFFAMLAGCGPFLAIVGQMLFLKSALENDSTVLRTIHRREVTFRNMARYVLKNTGPNTSLFVERALNF